MSINTKLIDIKNTLQDNNNRDTCKINPKKISRDEILPWKKGQHLLCV